MCVRGREVISFCFLSMEDNKKVLVFSVKWLLRNASGEFHTRTHLTPQYCYIYVRSTEKTSHTRCRAMQPFLLIFLQHIILFSAATAKYFR